MSIERLVRFWNVCCLKEKQKKYESLKIHEKFALNFGRFILSSHQSRTFFVIYFVLVHILIFLVNSLSLFSRKVLLYRFDSSHSIKWLMWVHLFVICHKFVLTSKELQILEFRRNDFDVGLDFENIWLVYMEKRTFISSMVIFSNLSLVDHRTHLMDDITDIQLPYLFEQHLNLFNIH